MFSKNYYWKITKKAGFRASLVHLGFPEDRINSILSRLEHWKGDECADRINKQGYFFASISENNNNYRSYEWNDYDYSGGFSSYGDFQYNGEVVLRKQKLERLKEISDGT